MSSKIDDIWYVSCIRVHFWQVFHKLISESNDFGRCCFVKISSWHVKILLRWELCQKTTSNLQSVLKHQTTLCTIAFDWDRFLLFWRVVFMNYAMISCFDTYGESNTILNFTIWVFIKGNINNIILYSCGIFYSDPSDIHVL